MPDRDETLLPLHAWTGVLEQLSLPLRVYRRQLMRSYEPGLALGEQILQAYGGWMRYWARLVYWERLVITTSVFDAPRWEAEGDASAVSGRWNSESGRALRLRGATVPQLPGAGRTAPTNPRGPVMRIGSRAEKDRVLADLASALEIAHNQIEQLTSSLVTMLEEQMRLLASISTLHAEGAGGDEKQAPQ